MRTIMMGLVLATTMGCATVGSVGVNTSSHGIWYQDCGVSRAIPGGTATFNGTLTSPNSSVATEEQQPPKSSNVKGVIRVIVPHPDTCNGKGVDLVELTEEALVTPSAAGPKMHRYKVESIPPARWSE